jgi:pyruvate kinase
MARAFRDQSADGITIGVRGESPYDRRACRQTAPSMRIITEFDLLKYRRTKIVATLGPASNDPATVRALLAAGVNVVRLNMSHGDHEFHRTLFERVREASAALARPVGILADLCGPKIRTGTFAGGAIVLEAGATVTVTTRDLVGGPDLIPSQYAGLATDVKSGDRILLDDGALELRVEHVTGTEVRCRVVHGGMLKDHKGINLPGVTVSAPSVTAKDRDDALFALRLGVDFLALSFVRRGSDLDELRQLARGAGFEPFLIAKIEKPEALDNSEEILAAADGIMIARGDLGVELSPEQVPVAQHQLIGRARAANKPVIVATQMLESMIANPRPTRAEVTDVSHAVSLGADAVMLSGETASGAHPVAAVEIMDRIAKQTEAFFWTRASAIGTQIRHQEALPVPFGDAVADACAQLTFDLQARAVLVISHGGMSAATVTAARPAAPVVAISGNPATCRRMTLMWGALPVLADDVGATNPNRIARRIARQLELAEPGQHIVLVRGFHGDPDLNTPSITVLRV